MRRSIPALLSTCRHLAAIFALTSLTSMSAVSMAATTTSDTTSATTSTDTARVIVKFRKGSALMAQAAGQANAPQRARALGVRTGRSLKSGLAISETMQVVTADGLSSKELAAELAKDSNVEFAEEDQRRYKTEVPNDPLYGDNQASALTAGQWYLRPPSSDIPATVNAEGAWDISTGSPTVVVAVLDSGIRKDHADLAANIVGGYDMITNVPTANDGDGRDADASDPGDWITSDESLTRGGSFYNCTVESSSWHGTQVSGLIAASTDNNLGMASIGRNVKILPVRVLGKCGGYDSDIQAAMRWAVGLQVGTLPINPNPAKVLNMSLGSSGTCSASYASAIADVNAQGALIVAAAGNSAGEAVGTPANCAGVLAVGGLRHTGTKVGYSDLGPQIGISAPAGNCVTSSGTCQYPILTTSNAGTTTPVVGSSIYTDGGDDASLGTSFSAPLVSGTAALVWSARPGLTRDEVLTLLKTSARPFPASGAAASGSSIPQCTAPTGTDQLECYCTTSTCGAGMLDTTGATTLATTGLYGRISSSPTPALAAQPVTLDASATLLAAGRSITSYAWSIASTGGVVNSFSSGTDQATATVTPTANGIFTVTLTVTDNTGVTSTVSRAITVGATAVATTTPAVTTAPVVATNTDSGGGGGGAIDVSWLAMLAVAVGAMQMARRRARD